jgi:hypothetical protein
MEEEQKEERPDPGYFMSYENNKWVLNIKDPVTKEVVEQRVSSNGRWQKLVKPTVAPRRSRY